MDRLIHLLLPTSYFLLLTSYFLLPTSYFLLPTSCFLLPTSYFLLPTSYFLLPTSYFLLPTSYFLLPVSYFYKRKKTKVSNMIISTRITFIKQVVPFFHIPKRGMQCIDIIICFLNGLEYQHSKRKQKGQESFRKDNHHMENMLI